MARTETLANSTRGGAVKDVVKDVVKDTVRRYFDAEVVGYLDAYETARPGDARHDAFQERRELVLGMTPPDAGRVLDIGAGPGVFTSQLVGRGATCTVVDLSYEMVAMARRQLERTPGPTGPGLQALQRALFMVADIDRLPFAAASFDAVLCVGVLQYLPSLDLALAELARVTAPGGHVIVTYPNARSPLNRLHRVVIAAARASRATAGRLGMRATPDPSRLTFRSDIPNRWFSAKEIARLARAADLVPDRVIYHGLQFPFAVPGLGFATRGWNRRIRGRFPTGAWTTWGREGIMRLKRAP